MPKCLYASTSSEATQHSTKDCVRVEYDRTAFAWDYQTTIPSRIWALPGASPRVPTYMGGRLHCLSDLSQYCHHCKLSNNEGTS